MSSKTADCIPTTNDASRKMVGSEHELIATPFGHLTRDEIREWEKMLGAPLLTLPTQA
jgi:hypothetical protein